MGRHKSIVLFVAVSAAVSAVLAAVIPGFRYDELCYALWQQDMAAHGLQAAYAASQGQWCPINYPPVYPALLDVYTHLLGYVPAAGTLASKGLPVLLWVAACAALAAVIWHKNVSWRAFAAFALNPVFLLDGPIWGQTDVLYTALSAGALLACDARPALAGALFALALLAKPLAIAVAPALAATLCLARPGACLRRLAAFAAGAVGAFIPVLLPFAVQHRLIPMLRAAFGTAVGTYNHFTSVSAGNLWWWTFFTTTFRHDTYRIAGAVSLRAVGMALVIAAVLGVLLWQVRALRNRRAGAWAVTLQAGAACYFAMFFLATEMQERYEYPVVFLLALLYVLHAEGRAEMLLASLASFVNMLGALPDLLRLLMVAILPVALINGLLAWEWARSMLGANRDRPAGQLAGPP